jgi:AraC family transcriptional regulator, arabinose operon regulatory protein
MTETLPTAAAELPPFSDIDHPRVSLLPRPMIGPLLSRPVTRRLLVTDVGWFDHAGLHAISRPRGAHESIVLICVGGSGWVEVDGVRHGVGASTVALIPEHRPHGYGSSATNPWTIWWCHLRGTDVPELISATGATPEKPVLSLWNPERCVSLIDEILTGMNRDQSPIRLTAAAGAAWKLLTQIASDRLAAERDAPLQRAMDYLADRLDSPIRVADLAQLVGISESHLTALFRRTTGGGVTAHHTALRMARARHLLDGSPYPIADVARAVGYTDALYFSRVFRRVHGMSPTEYRAQRKG